MDEVWATWLLGRLRLLSSPITKTYEGSISWVRFELAGSGPHLKFDPRGPPGRSAVPAAHHGPPAAAHSACRAAELLAIVCAAPPIETQAYGVPLEVGRGEMQWISRGLAGARTCIGHPPMTSMWTSPNAVATLIRCPAGFFPSHPRQVWFGMCEPTRLEKCIEIVEQAIVRVQYPVSGAQNGDSRTEGGAHGF